MESNVSANLKELFKSMENFLVNNTVVGEPITIGNIIIIPLVDIKFGVGVGAAQKNNDKDRAGGGMGGEISPNALLVIKDGKHQIINIKNQESLGKMLDMVPGIIEKFMSGNEENKTTKDKKVTKKTAPKKVAETKK